MYYMPNDECFQSKRGIGERQLEVAGKDDGRHDDRSRKIPSRIYVRIVLLARSTIDMLSDCGTTTLIMTILAVTTGTGRISRGLVRGVHYLGHCSIWTNTPSR